MTAIETQAVSTSELANHETFDYDIERYTLHNQQISVVIATGMETREALNLSSQIVTETIRNFPETGVAYILYDASRAKSVTPYARQKALDLLRNVEPNRDLYLAIVFANSWMSTLMSAFISQISRMVSSHIRIKLFSNYDAAAQWLMKMRKG